MQIQRKPAVRLLMVWACVLALLLPVDAFAWGATGHEAVAFLAWQQMTPAARTEAMRLIRLVPQLTSPTHTHIDGFPQWLTELPAGLSSDEQNLDLFMRAATWADSIKHVGFEDSDNPPPGVPVDHPLGFTDEASHGYWHFVDKGVAAHDPATPVPNAAVQITELRSQFASAADDNLKAYELVWLLHLVGDVHQPLHGARRFVAGKSDLGGNSVKISLSPDLKAKFLANRPAGARGSAPSELHAFWDDLPGVTTDPALALQAAADFAKTLAAPPAAEVAIADPGAWANASFQLAKKAAYVTPVGPGNTGANGKAFAMTAPYYNTALGDAKAQIALAGARLAKMLNDLLGAPSGD